MTRFALINRGTVASPIFPQVTAAWLARVAAAVTIQLNAHLGPVWGVDDFEVIVSDGTNLAPGTIVFALVDQLPDAPGAIAYHSTDAQALPIAFLALSTCNTLDDVATGISHECCETACDPECNLWAADGEAIGRFFSYEVCDPVESTMYAIQDSVGQVAVSDFVFPSFFAVGGQAPYSYCQAHFSASTPAAPFVTAPGGYQVSFVSDAEPQSISAEAARRRHPMHKHRTMHWSSRSGRRLKQIGALP